MSKTYRIAAAVLAGGHSTRMGSPKESMVIAGDGRTFLEKICDELDAALPDPVSGRYLSLREDQEITRGGYRIVRDRYPETGPLGGIASVLEKAKEDGFDAVLVLAVDLVRYDAGEIRRICARYDGEDILFARTEGQFLQPLASIYAVTVLPAAEEQIGQQDYRIRNLAEKAGRTAYFDTDRTQVYENRNSPI